MEERIKQTKALHKANRARQWYAVLALVVFIGAIFAISKLTSNKETTLPNSPPTAVIQVTKNGFEPTTISVKQGTKVIWTNKDDTLHQIASNPYPKNTDLPDLKSEILNNNQTYTYTATKPGTFGYHDQLSPTINGTLVVQKR